MVSEKYKPALPPRVMKISEQIRRGLMRDPMKERRFRRPRSAFDFMPRSTVIMNYAPGQFEKIFGKKDDVEVHSHNR